MLPPLPFASARSLLRRSRNDSLLRNSVYLMASTMVSSALGYIFWTAAARLYAPAAVGGAAALVSAMSLASLIGGIGSSQAIVGELPGRQKPHAWSAAVTAALLVTGTASVVAGLVTAALLAVAGHNPQLYYNGYTVATLVAGVVLTTASLLLESVWIAERQAGWMLVYTTVFSAGKLLLLALPGLVVFGALGIFGAWVVMLTATLAAVLITLARMYGFRPQWSRMRTEIAAMKTSLAGNYLVSVGDMTPVYLIPILVSARLSAVDTAYFYAAWKIGSFFPVFASSVGSSLFAEGAHVPRRALALAYSGMRMVMPFIAVGTIVAIAAGKIVLGLFGSGYAEHAYGLLVLLAISAFPDSVVNIFRSVLRVQRRYGMASFIVWIITLTRILLTWFLLPTMGIVGAGWAWLATQCLGAAIVAVDLAMHRNSSAVVAGSMQEQNMINIEASAPEGWG